VQCSVLISDPTNSQRETEREIEDNSGDSWIDKLAVNPVSGSAHAVLVSGAGLAEYRYVNDGGDEMSVAVYLDTDDETSQQAVIQRIRELVDVLGFQESGDPNIEHGSIFRRSWARLKRGLTSTEVTQRLVKVERAFEIVLIEQQQADTDLKEAQAVGQLLSSLEPVPQACIRVGSILMIKYQGAQGTIILSRNLSQLEIRALERFPEIQQNPQKVLQSLSLAVSQLDGHPASDFNREN
jgi:hypothetical protein